MRQLRIAVVQLECHPAIHASHIKYLEEPFESSSGLSLSRLSTKGLNLDAAQRFCAERYIRWQEDRLRAVIDFLDARKPAPDIVVFPEGSVPLESIGLLADWSAKSGATVLAGTHTPRHSPGAKRRYSALGVSEGDQRRLSKLQSTNALPLISSGVVNLIPKRLSSVFERSNLFTSEPALPRISPEPLPRSLGSVLPLICSEALRTHNVRSSYDVVCICSYDAKPSQFDDFIGHQVRDRKIVVYCNDGRFGGSGVFSVRDNRIPDWLNDAFGHRLPAGDAILIVDADLDTTAVEVGTAAPSQAVTLVAVGSIVGGRSNAADVSRQLAEIGGLREPAARAQELVKLLQNQSLSELHAKRLRQLQSLDVDGVASVAWWESLGADCLVADQFSLAELEAELATACTAQLTDPRVLDFSRNPDVATELVTYLAECQKRGSAAVSTTQIPQPKDSAVVVDREREIRDVHQFLDNDALTILEITGLPQIGKSAALAKAIAQYGRPTEILRIPIQSSSSIDYIILSILRSRPGSPVPPYADPLETIASATFAEALRPTKVVILERADSLLERTSWRDELMPKALTAIAEQARTVGTKLILETSRELPIELVDTSIRYRVRVTGMDRNRVDAGVSIFETQLRRVGLDPTAISRKEKELVVNRLGGHPAAIGVAADISFDHGLAMLLKDLGQLKGFFLHYVDRMVTRLELSDAEKHIMQLLSLARGAIPREALLGSVDFAASSDIRDLIALGAIEVTPEDRLEVAGVLRDYFTAVELPQATRAAFHAAAADALDVIAAKSKDLFVIVEAEFHSTMVGRTASIASSLVDAAMASAEEFFRTQQYDDAIRILSPLLRGRSNVSALRLAAQIEARRNNLGPAVGYASEAFRRDPKNTWLLAQLVKIALTQNQVEFAEEIIDLAQRAGVEDEQIHIARGRIFLRRDNVDAAIEAFDRARQLTRRNPWPYFFLGRIYVRRGRLDDAVSILHDGERFAYDVRSRDRVAIRAIKTLLGTVYLFTHLYDLAEQYILSVIEENPDGPEEQRAHAALLVTQGKITDAHEAVAVLRKVRARSPEERGRQQLFVGQFYEAIADLYQAAQEYRVAYQMDRGNVLVMLRLANVLIKLAAAAYHASEPSYEAYAEEAAEFLRSVFRYDRENAQAIKLMQTLSEQFGVKV